MYSIQKKKKKNQTDADLQQRTLRERSDRNTEAHGRQSLIQTCGSLLKLPREVQALGTAAGWKLADAVQ